MPATQITVIAYLTVQPGTEQGFLDRFAAIVAQTRAEPGCINYDFHRSATTPHCFVFYENYVDQAAFDRHLTQPYIVAWVEYAQLHGATFTVEYWQMISTPARA